MINKKTKNMLLKIRSILRDMVGLVALAEMEDDEKVRDSYVEELIQLNEDVSEEVSSNWH